MRGKWLAEVQYLIASADASFLNVIDESVLASLMAIGGDISDFSSATDSLEALADAVSAVVTAAVVGALDTATTIMAYVKQIVSAIISGTYGLSALQVLIAAIQTDLDNGTDGLGALKALIDLVQIDTTAIIADLDNGTDGLGALKALIDPIQTDTTAIIADLDNGTDGLSALKSLIDAIPTTMVGTNLAFLASVGGALDTAAATGAVSDAKLAMAYIKQLVTNSEASEVYDKHVPKFGGEVWYVSKAGNDSNNGFTPNTAKLTITAAEAAASAGDAINIMAGTYVENVVVNLDSLELWCEIGAIIAPSTGIGLVLSGGHHRVNGRLQVNAYAGAAGVQIVTNGNCVLENIVVSGGGTGFDIDSTGNELRACHSNLPTAFGFDVDGARCELIDCDTIGTGSSSVGYSIGAVTGGLLKSCTSETHAVSGFSFLGSSAQWTILDCSSGGGDGRWVDTDNANVWSNFSYDDEIFKEIDFTDNSTVFNLFKITGIVKIEGIFGQVEEALNTEIGNCKLEMAAGGNTEALTTTVSLNSVAVGSFIGKTSSAGNALVVGSSAAPQVIENANYRDPEVVSIIVAEAGTDTYLRLLSDDSVGTKDGVIRWHCHWSPVSDDGFVEAA